LKEVIVANPELKICLQHWWTGQWDVTRTNETLEGWKKKTKEEKKKKAKAQKVKREEAAALTNQAGLDGGGSGNAQLDLAMKLLAATKNPEGAGGNNANGNQALVEALVSALQQQHGSPTEQLSAPGVPESTPSQSVAPATPSPEGAPMIPGHPLASVESVTEVDRVADTFWEKLLDGDKLEDTTPEAAAAMLSKLMAGETAGTNEDDNEKVDASVLASADPEVVNALVGSLLPKFKDDPSAKAAGAKAGAAALLKHSTASLQSDITPDADPVSILAALMPKQVDAETASKVAAEHDAGIAEYAKLKAVKELGSTPAGG